MINEIRIANFRSILASKVPLAASGLTVLVGANGSGKTNIVRALEFISTLNSEGIQSAVINQGGQRSLFPKSIPYKNLRGTVAKIDYRLTLSRPQDYPHGSAPPSARHKVEYRLGNRNEIRLESEVLEFGQVIPVARALDTPYGGKPDLTNLPGRSTVRFHRANNGIKVTSHPPMSKRHARDYVGWFGLQFLEQAGIEIDSGRDILQFLESFQEQLKEREQFNPNATMMEIAGPLLTLSEHARIFKQTAGNIKRFELHAANLKGDQQPSRGWKLSEQGENLPAVVRRLTSETGSEETWERVLSTLTDVAPFVFGVKNNLLKSGREYVEFIETRTGRPVESWDASDGTLRALAILLAVETHPRHQTLVIEEPEKGLHPWAVRFLLQHVRDGIERRGIQVVVTTHSPQVLEAAEPTEVLVVTRSHEQGTRVAAALDALPAAEISSTELGRLWVKGLIGGHPHD